MGWSIRPPGSRPPAGGLLQCWRKTHRDSPSCGPLPQETVRRTLPPPCRESPIGPRCWRGMTRTRSKYRRPSRRRTHRGSRWSSDGRNRRPGCYARSSRECFGPIGFGACEPVEVLRVVDDEHVFTARLSGKGRNRRARGRGPARCDGLPCAPASRNTGQSPIAPRVGIESAVLSDVKDIQSGRSLRHDGHRASGHVWTGKVTL